MQYDWITGIIMLLAVGFLVASMFVLFRRKWFLAWLRGTLGILLLLVAADLAIVALNFYSFKNLQSEVPISTVSFERLGPQHYRATVSQPHGAEGSYDLKGDLWQIDARLIKWTSLWTSLGFSPGYKLDRIQGRYLSLEQERGDERTVYALSEPEFGFDMWAFLNQNRGMIPGVDASFGSATYVPMTDGGIFSVALSNGGLVARPLNDRAQAAIEAWE